MVIWIGSCCTVIVCSVVRVVVLFVMLVCMVFMDAFGLRLIFLVLYVMFFLMMTVWMFFWVLCGCQDVLIRCGGVVDPCLIVRMLLKFCLVS